MRRPPVRAFRARIRRYVRGYERRFILIGAISFVGGILEAAVLVTIVPLVQGIASEDGTGQLHVLGPFDFSALTVGQLVMIGLALVAARLVVQLVLAHQRARLNADWDENLRTRVFNAFVDADWELQSQEPAAHVQELLTAHLGNSQAILAALSNGWVAFFNLLVLVAAALVVDPLGAAIIITFGLSMFAVMRPLSTRTQTVNEELSRRNLEYVQTIGDTAHLTREIRTFGVGEEVKTGFADEVAHIRRLRLRGMFLGGSLAVLYQNVVIAVVLIGLGAVYVLDPSHLTALAVVALVLIRAMAYSQSLHGTYHSLSESGPYLERLTDKEISYSMRPLATGAIPVEHIESLRFDDVSYTYPAADGANTRVATEALRGVSFTVDRGRLIGIVGPSGSGKSTLVQLLLGLRVPTSGHLLVNGVDAAVLRRDEWFHRVSFVPQEPTLFAGTVAENIAFHRPWVDDDAVIAAARRAHLHDDVLAWEQGYDTHVGDRGSQVSGGQRQRICIARALVDNPDIIIFDEPTSALDVHSELAIQQTLEELRLGTFLFIVAHRLSTLDTCDEIMVLTGGQLQGFAAAADLQLTNPWFAEALELSSLSTGGRRDPSPAPPRSAVS